MSSTIATRSYAFELLGLADFDMPASSIFADTVQNFISVCRVRRRAVHAGGPPPG